MQLLATDPFEQASVPEHSVSCQGEQTSFALVPRYHTSILRLLFSEDAARTFCISPKHHGSTLGLFLPSSLLWHHMLCSVLCWQGWGCLLQDLGTQRCTWLLGTPPRHRVLKGRAGFCWKGDGQQTAACWFQAQNDFLNKQQFSPSFTLRSLLNCSACCKQHMKWNRSPCPHRGHSQWSTGDIRPNAASTASTLLEPEGPSCSPSAGLGLCAALCAVGSRASAASPCSQGEHTQLQLCSPHKSSLRFVPFPNRSLDFVPPPRLLLQALVGDGAEAAAVRGLVEPKMLCYCRKKQTWVRGIPCITFLFLSAMQY